MNRYRWAVFVGALVLAGIVGAIAYNAGLAQGIEQSGKVITAPPGPYPYYGWHRPWGFGFFVVPFFFVAFWLLMARGFYGRRCGGGLEEWHRRAHERMWNGEDDPGRR